MALSEIEQIKKLIEEKKHILITFRTDGRGDAIGSAIAWRSFLHAQGKRAEIVCSDFVLPGAYRFLPAAGLVKASPGHLQKFILTVDIDKTGIQELSYDVKDAHLRIFITPKTGFITKDDIRTAQSDFQYDLVFVLDTPDLNSLGKLYANNTDFFYQTTTVNIDHQAGNEHFGQLNLVDLTASTTAELLYRLMNEIKPEIINTEMATALLTGMIAGTGSFKKNNVRPRTLAVASELVNLGADRGTIVKNLFQTKSIATFKLWGAALTHLEHDPGIGLVWSSITREDFIRAGANENDLAEIIDELIANSPAAKFILLLHEHPQPSDAHTIHGIFQVSNGRQAKELMLPFAPQGDSEQCTFTINGQKTLREVEQDVVSHLKKQTLQT
ncbi:MAG: Phosphoesterase RecJ domain protein [Candidatus Magasanikbacteria bacterium GW2011_GWA2_56_11]|uniref:Phosphoesterase RecJ domain protein n=1 Tax=Candidatus Magasanikbacteria bacterium GW2011_GWA2_56_11 TaxID=1619044 RepID=A0A0G1YI77_9BACT|nr:MAG: Phosphoesterase RecJ domain protein [Candidatus Magasanikbacteria bacterium GW2011_GWA2_56_11]